MAGYGNFNLNKKRRGNKLFIIAAVVAAVILAALCYIGIVANSNGEEMQRISTAVSENTQLKEEISELNAEIVRLQEEINDLTMQLEARPTSPPAPERTEPPIVSPRGGLR